jgi:ribosomal protein L35
MPKKKAVHAAAAKRRRRAPWGKLLRGRPTERHIFIGNERIDLDEEVLRERQYYVMQSLLQHYGIEGHVPPYPKGLADRSWWPWYQLALAMASELDDSLKIVDGRPPGKTAPRWRGAEGASLIRSVDALKRAKPNRSIRWCLRVVQEKVIPNSFGRMTLDELEARYYEARRHRRTTKRARIS